MKKTLFIILIISNIISYGQETTYNKKHNLLIDFGINHSRNFKPEYHPAFKTNMYYPPSETLYPGYYTYPSFNFKHDVIYRYYFYKGFNLNFKLCSSYWKKVQTTSIDSLNKYYIYSDSTINSLEAKYPGYKFYGPPLYNKSERYRFDINFSLGYRYKRFFISSGIQYPVFEIFSGYITSKNNKSNKYLYTVNIFSDNPFGYFLDTKIEFLVIKQKIPLSIYTEVNDGNFFFGFIINTFKINLK